MSAKALASYRNLLRARALVFKDDNRALVAARDEIRKYFEDVRLTSFRGPDEIPPHSV